MRGINTWSYTPYRQFDDEQEDYIYISRLAPGMDSIEVEWLANVADAKEPAEYEVYYKKTDDADFLVNTAKGNKALLTELAPDTDYELYITAGHIKSRNRLARTGFVPGTVVNYLHPKDDYYRFSGKYLCSPSIVKLKSGALLASMDVYASQSPQNLSFIFRSDDGGESWHYVTDLFPCFWGKLFVHREELYMLAMSTEYGDLLIGKSTDEGKSFGTPAVLFRGSCSFKEKGLHKAPMPITAHTGRLWTAIDFGAWSQGGHASCLLSVDENADLMNAENWSLTKPLKYDSNWEGAVAGESRGLLEGSAVASKDGDILNFLGYRTGGCEPDRDKAILLKGNLQNPDKQLEFYKTVDFYGNRAKFSVIYDEVSKMYFSIVNRLEGENKSGMRNIAALSVSPDLIHWEIVCDLLNYSNEDTSKAAFQYIDFTFDKDDILYLSRTAFNQAASFHDSNYITFHRVKNFRGLLNNETISH